MKLRLFSLLVAAMACASVRACTEWGGGVHLGTYHFDRSGERREFNPGLYVRCNDYSAGLYVNSASKPSWWAGRTWRQGPVGLTAGVVTGYSRTSPVTALVVVTVDLPSGFRLGLFPNSGGRSGGVHLMRDF